MKLNTIENPDRLLRRFIALSQNPDFEVVIEFLKIEQKKLDKSLRKSKENTQILQGQSQFLESFLDLAENASSYLKK